MSFAYTEDDYSEAVIALNAIRLEWRDRMLGKEKESVEYVLSALSENGSSTLHMSLLQNLDKRKRENNAKEEEIDIPIGPEAPLEIGDWEQTDVVLLHRMLGSYVEKTRAEVLPAISMGPSGYGPAYVRIRESQIAQDMMRDIEKVMPELAEATPSPKPPFGLG